MKRQKMIYRKTNSTGEEIAMKIGPHHQINVCMCSPLQKAEDDQ